MSDINDNIISRKWQARCSKLPADVREKLGRLENSPPSEYQLQVIKRSRTYPEIGDIFKINPIENLDLFGIVLNNHISNINGDDLLLVLIFKQNIDISKSLADEVSEDDLLIPPQIVGQEYRSRGYFYNVGKYDKPLDIADCGFYSVGKGRFFDEFGNELAKQPRLLGTFGVATITGVAKKIRRELIIMGGLYNV